MSRPHTAYRQQRLKQQGDRESQPLKGQYDSPPPRTAMEQRRGTYADYSLHGSPPPANGPALPPPHMTYEYKYYHGNKEVVGDTVCPAMGGRSFLEGMEEGGDMCRTEEPLSGQSVILPPLLYADSSSCSYGTKGSRLSPASDSDEHVYEIPD